MSDLSATRQAYEHFLISSIEHYKNSIHREDLLQIGDEAIRRMEKGSRGHQLTEVLLLETVDRIIVERLTLPTFRQWRLQEALKVESTPTLVGIDGGPIGTKQRPRLLVSAKTTVESLLAELKKDPALLYQLSPRKFEEVIADLLDRQGFACELTPASHDGGKDIIARCPTPIGSFLLYVECKRYAPEHRVGVSLVRQLLGVVAHDRVSGGLLVTTSSFSAGARDLQATDPHRLTLRDYQDIKAWLAKTAP